MGMSDGVFVELGVVGFRVRDCVGLNDRGKVPGQDDNKLKSKTDKPQVSPKVLLQTSEPFLSRTVAWLEMKGRGSHLDHLGRHRNSGSILSW